MRKLPDLITYFVDADLGSSFHATLSDDDRFAVEFHDDHFPAGTDDEDWLEHIASMGWIGLTHDRKMRRQHRQIIQNCGARVIVLVGHHPMAELAQNFRASYPKIERFVRNHDAPYVARLRRPTPKELRTKQKPKGHIVLWE